MEQHAALGWLSLVHVAGVPLPDDGLWHVQADRAVDRPAAPGDLRIGVLGADLIAQEVRRLAGGVGDQRLGLGQFQLEFLAQERRDLRLDLLGLVLRTGEPEQAVVGIADYRSRR